MIKKATLVIVGMFVFFAFGNRPATAEYTISPESWLQYLPNYSYKLITSSNGYVESGHLQINLFETATEKNGAIKVRLGGKEVELYTDWQLNSSVGTVYAYNASTDVVHLYFVLDFTSNRQVDLKHWIDTIQEGLWQNGLWTITIASPPIYEWNYDSWGPCSNQCGYGTQARSVWCENENNNTVDLSNCDPVQKPPISQSCKAWNNCYPEINYFNRNPSDGDAPLQVHFSADAYDPDGGLISYSIDTDDGKTYNSSLADHIYSNAGTYTAVLTVTDNEGKHATQNAVVTVSAPLTPSQLELKNSSIPTSVSWNGGTYAVEIHNTGEESLFWNVQNIPVWVSLSPDNGDVNGYDSLSIAVIVNPNNDINSRMCELQFTNVQNSYNNLSLQINQNGTVPRIEVNPKSLVIDEPLFTSLASTIQEEQDIGLKQLVVVKETNYVKEFVIPDEVKRYWKTHKPLHSRDIQSDQQNWQSIIDWSSFDSPVDPDGQGKCGACWAFAAIALIENLGNQANLPVEQNLSEQVIISCTSGDCRSGFSGSALKYIRNSGARPEDCYPYAGASGNSGNCNHKCSYPDFLEKITTIECGSAMFGLWGGSPSVNVLKEALQNGPITVILNVPKDNSFDNYSGGIYNYSGDGEMKASHVVLATGYDDTQQCFKAKNSWGNQWGEGGYFRIAYDDVTDNIKFGGYGCGASGVYLSGTEKTFVIKNVGTGSLLIEDISISKNWLKCEPETVSSIASGEQREILVSVTDWDSISSSENTATISISSNDSSNHSVIIEVMAIKASTQEQPLVGDLNGDQLIDLTDALLVFKVLARINTSETIQLNVALIADVNGDEKIGLEEVVFILQTIADLR